MNDLTIIEPPIKTVTGEVLAPGEEVMFLQRSAFTSAKPITVAVREGATLADYMAALDLPPALVPHCHIYIGEEDIHPSLWHCVRPKFGHVVTVRVLPQGSDNGKNILRMVILIAIVIAANALIPGAGAAAGSAAGIGHAVGVAAVAFVASLALNALIPPPRVKNSVNSRDAFLTGGSNAFTPYGPIPRVLGKHRVFPVIAAHPYTEIAGKKQYLRLLLCVGFGPVKISDIRIGNTPLTSFTGVQYEVSEGGPSGWSGNKTITLYNQQVRETSLNITMATTGTTAAQVSQLATSELSVDIAFPQGLVEYTKKGEKKTRTVDFKIEYRTAGSSNAWSTPTWLNNEDTGTLSGGILRAAEATNQEHVITGRWKVASGQWEVRITRQTAAGVQIAGGNNQIDTATWVTFRSVVDAAPVNQTDVCLIAIRIKASDQLQGQVENINCIAEAYLPVYSAGVWTPTLTRSPAWAFCDILRRRGPTTMLADSRLDIAAIQAWDTAAAATPANDAGKATWEYNGVIEGGAVFDAARQIAAVGRASFAIVDGKYSVVRDVVQASPVQAITPRNSWGYSATKTYYDLPHALKVRFKNEEKNWQDDEIYAYADGYNQANATKFDTMDLPGITFRNMAWREGRYHLAVGSARPEEHAVNMDPEGLRCTVGDRVQLAHDAISVGLGWGRVLSNNSNGTSVTQLNLDSTVSFQSGSTYQMRVRHGDGTSSIRTVTPPAGTPLHDNLVRNSIAAGGALGSPGTLPTNWVDASTGGLTRQVVAMGDDYIDVRFSGTAAGAVYIDLRPDGAIGVSPNTTYAASVSVALKAGNAPSAATVTLVEYNGGTSVGQTNSNITLGSFLKQATSQRAFGATGNTAYSQVTMSFGAGTYDFTLRISQWQVESNGGPNAYIQTSGSARTLYDPVSSVTIASEPVATAPAADTLFMFGLTGLESMPCVVKKIEANADLSVKLTLVAYDPAILTADTGTIPAFSSYITTTTDPRDQKPTAPVVAVRSDDSVIDVSGDGTQNIRIAVDIRPAGSSLVPIATWEVQYREGGVVNPSSAWMPATGNGIVPASMTTVFCGPTRVGGEYDVQVRAISVYGIPSDWTTVLAHMGVGKTLAPEVPSSPSVVGGYRNNYVTWINPVDADLAYVEVFASQTNSVGTAVSIGKSYATIFHHTNLSSSATWYYWVRSVDTAGNASALVSAGAGTTGTISDGGDFSGDLDATTGDNYARDGGFVVINSPQWMFGGAMIRANTP